MARPSADAKAALPHELRPHASPDLTCESGGLRACVCEPKAVESVLLVCLFVCLFVVRAFASHSLSYISELCVRLSFESEATLFCRRPVGIEHNHPPNPLRRTGRHHDNALMLKSAFRMCVLGTCSYTTNKTQGGK